MDKLDKLMLTIMLLSFTILCIGLVVLGVCYGIITEELKEIR